ncbi:MAG: sigma 54-interacting transcriptional regulator, partial [Phycisphaerae bacterium]
MSSIDTDILLTKTKKYCQADVLIVDNDPQFEQVILQVLARKGIRGIIAESTKAAIEKLEKDTYQLIFISAQAVSAGNISGYTGLLKTIKSINPETPVVLVTQIDEFKKNNPAELAAYTVGNIKAGFYDMLVKPVESKKIENILDRLIPNHNLSTLAAANEDSNDFYCIVGRSAKLTQTINLAQSVAKTSAPVLISGESGTGKELISYMIHYQSKRSEGPYIRVNCAAL